MEDEKTLFEGEVKFMNIRDQLVIKATIKAGHETNNLPSIVVLLSFM